MFEMIFMLSLGVTFILIIVMVYYFKKKVNSIETKCDTMYEIINDIVSELEHVKAQPIMPSHKLNDVIQQFPLAVGGGAQRKIQVLLSDSEDDSDSDDDSEDDSVVNNDNDIDDSDSDSDSEDSDSEDSDIIKSIHTETEDSLKIINIDLDDTPVSIEKQLMEPSIILNDINHSLANIEVYKKYKIPELRQLVIARGLCSDPSKLKKPELLELLQILD